MNKMVDYIESLARYLKARHAGELFLFAMSVLLLTWTVSITLVNSQNAQSFDGLAKNIQYFIQWLMAMAAHSVLTLVTAVVFFKGWGKKRLIVLCLLFQGISLAGLFFYLPLK